MPGNVSLGNALAFAIVLTVALLAIGGLFSWLIETGPDYVIKHYGQQGAAPEVVE